MCSLIYSSGIVLQDDIVEGAVARGWLRDPVRVATGPTTSVPAGILHRVTVVPAERRMAALCRLLRQDLQACAST